MDRPRPTPDPRVIVAVVALLALVCGLAIWLSQRGEENEGTPVPREGRALTLTDEPTPSWTRPASDDSAAVGLGDALLTLGPEGMTRLDDRTGEVLWKNQHVTQPYAIDPDNQVLWVSGGARPDTTAFALDLGTGKVRQRHPDTTDVRQLSGNGDVLLAHPTGPEVQDLEMVHLDATTGFTLTGVSAWVVTADEFLVVTQGQQVSRYNLVDGARMWSIDTGHDLDSDDLAAFEDTVAVNLGDQVQTFDLETGEQASTHEASCESVQTTRTPAFECRTDIDEQADKARSTFFTRDDVVGSVPSTPHTSWSGVEVDDTWYLYNLASRTIYDDTLTVVWQGPDTGSLYPTEEGLYLAADGSLSLISPRGTERWKVPLPTPGSEPGLLVSTDRTVVLQLGTDWVTWQAAQPAGTGTS